MSEDFFTDYKDGDIVWVKLGPSWWPGEVKDINNIPTDEIEFKKPPLAVVKFFEEDAYEYVRNWANIYPYNCEKKMEFIKKGMAGFRSNAPHMEKFPKDVTTAEIKKGGNPNILSDPACIPDKRRSQLDEVPKRNSKDLNKKSRSKDTSHITHRRFLGLDDYKAYICIQYPGKDRKPGDSEEEEIIRINTEPEQEYNCHSCPYTTKRLEVMILHTKSHIQGVYVSNSGRKRPVTSRPKKREYTKKKTVYYDDSSNEEIVEPPKEKRRKQKGASAKKASKKQVEEEKPKTTDIRTDLLAEWEDSEDESEMNTTKESDTINKSELSQLHKTRETSDEESEDLDVDKKDSTESEKCKDTSEMDSSTKGEIEKIARDVENKRIDSKSQMDKETQEAIKSCFDFDEDDEEDELINTTVEVGRKIPRVIPPTEKRKSESMEDESVANEGINKDEIMKVSQSFNQKLGSEETQEIENAFKDLMDTTSVPKLPDIENSLKPAQNFHAVRTVKFPDKPIESPKKDREKNTEVPINPKKRFVKSFEDFENQLQQEENRRREEENLKKKEDDLKNQVFLESKSSVLENREGSPDNSLISKDVSSDLSDNEMNESKIDLSKLQKSIMSKIIEEAKISEDSKDKIMSKMRKKTRKSKNAKAPVIEDKPQEKNEILQPSIESIKKDKIIPERKSLRKKSDNVKLETTNIDSYDLASSKSQEENVVESESNEIEEKGQTSKDFCSIKSKIEPQKDVLQEVNEVNSIEDNNEDINNSLQLTHENKVKDKCNRPVASPKRRSSRISSREPTHVEKCNEFVKEETDNVSEVIDSKVSIEKKETDNVSEVTDSKVSIEKKTRTSHPKKDKNLNIESEPSSGLKIDFDKNINGKTLTENVKCVSEFLTNEIKYVNETFSSYSFTSLHANVPGIIDGNLNQLSEIQPESEEELIIEKQLDLHISPVENKNSQESFSNTLDCESVSKSNKRKKSKKHCSKLAPEKKRKLSKDESDEDRENSEKVVEISDTVLKEKSLPMSTPEQDESYNENISSIISDEIKIDTYSHSDDKITEIEAVEEETIFEVTIEQDSSKSHIDTDSEQVEFEEFAKNVKETSSQEILSDNLAPNSFSDPNEAIIQEDVIISNENKMGINEENLNNELNSSLESSDTLVKEEETEISLKKTDETHNEQLSTVKDTVEEADNNDISLTENENIFEPTHEDQLIVSENENKTINESQSHVEDDINDQSVEKYNLESIKREEARKIEENNIFNDKEKLLESMLNFSSNERGKNILVEEQDDNKLLVSSEATEESLLKISKNTIESSQKDNLASDEIITDKKLNDDKASSSAEVEILCSNNSHDAFKFSIQTNLSNLSRSEEISAIALATLSEVKTDIDSNDSNSEYAASKVDPSFPEKLSETEMVAIEGNLTVMSEKDLVDAQVEITTDKVISSKKPAMLSSFSLDFSDSTSDSGSLNEISNTCKFSENEHKGTEFTTKAMTKELKPKVITKKANAYDQCELLDILEGNSEIDKKIVEFQTTSKTFSGDIMDFEDCIPSQIVCTKEYQKNMDDELKKKEKSSSVISTTSKLLERLTDTKHLDKESPVDSSAKNLNQKPKQSAIILSEQIVKLPDNKKVLPVSSNDVNDIEDVEAFVIHKDLKKDIEVEEPKVAPTKPARKPRSKPTGKAKILQQTIITPAGEIIQPSVTSPKKKISVISTTGAKKINTTESQQSLLSNKQSSIVVNQTETVNQDDNIFDIFNMPIVLSDQILTPENIDSMPIVIESSTSATKPTQSVLSTSTKMPVKKIVTKVITPTSTIISNNKLPGLTPKQKPRILQTITTKSTLAQGILPQKSGKYILVSQGGSGQQKIIQKKTIVKRSALPAGLVTKIGNAQETTGNKIMVVTNQQGHQQRLLLTPAQQKVLGYRSSSGPKITKTIVKTNVLQKNLIPISKSEAGSSKATSLLNQKVIPSSNQLLTTSKTVKTPIRKPVTTQITQKSSAVTSTSKASKTIFITNKHGQTIKKIATKDDDLDKQVAEQLEAIKASSGMQFGSQVKSEPVVKSAPKTPVRKPYSKKPEPKPKLTICQADMSNPPPLVATSPKKVLPFPTESKANVQDESKSKVERPLNQLVIQDALGNQTTITEGQILALPSETVDGQPQSYMLVTLDQSGNLTPLNNEALMSLDPNLGLGGDLSNMVLQIDQGSLGASIDQPMPLAQPATVKLSNPGEELQAGTSKIDIPRTSGGPVSLPVANDLPPLEPKLHQTILSSPSEAPVNLETIVQNSHADQGQQLIVTGDPIATQKFLESLTEGTTDLANIIANAEGKSILIQADGQQILINTNTDGALLQNVAESSEGGGNPIFATQPNKNTDILAAALADTDVFTTQPKISQLSPNNALYPINVGNVLETSLTLSSPIMTPLEVPSTNNKKIPDDEADILTQVPKNVDLPITITDPNISQTVANQQVATLIANELHTNLDLGLGISETTISTCSTGLTSPNYNYSLPSLDENDISHKPFNSSMPLLNDEVDEGSGSKSPIKDNKSDDNLSSENFLEEESRFTLGGGMCSSLSEPPPEMFDIPDMGSFGSKNGSSIALSLRSTPDSKDDDTTDISSIQAESSSEGSCEIPLQPKIVAKSVDLSESSEI